MRYRFDRRTYIARYAAGYDQYWLDERTRRELEHISDSVERLIVRESGK